MKRNTASPSFTNTGRPPATIMKRPWLLTWMRNAGPPGPLTSP